MGKQLSAQAFLKRVKSAMVDIGLNPKLRRAQLQKGRGDSGCGGGISTELIKRHRRWSSDCYERYIEESMGRLLAVTRSID